MKMVNKAVLNMYVIVLLALSLFRNCKRVWLKVAFKILFLMLPAFYADKAPESYLEIKKSWCKINVSNDNC